MASNRVYLSYFEFKFSGCSLQKLIIFKEFDEFSIVFRKLNRKKICFYTEKPKVLLWLILKLDQNDMQQNDTSLIKMIPFRVSKLIYKK